MIGKKHKNNQFYLMLKSVKMLLNLLKSAKNITTLSRPKSEGFQSRYPRCFQHRFPYKVLKAQVERCKILQILVATFTKESFRVWVSFIKIADLWAPMCWFVISLACLCSESENEHAYFTNLNTSYISI